MTTIRRSAAPVLAGVGAWLFVPVVGRISLTEIVAVALFPCCALALATRRRGRVVLLAGIVWVAGLLVGELVHPSDTTTLVKALSSAGVLVLTTGLVCWLLRAGPEAAARRLVAGFAIGQMVGIVVTPPSDVGLDPWKFGAGQGVTMLALVAADRLPPRVNRVATPVLLCVLAALHFALGARSLSLLALVLAVAALLTGGRRRSGGWLLLCTGVAALAAFGLSVLYTDLAGHGTLGVAEQEKISFQTGEFGIAVGGRKDFVYLIAGVADNPVVGWGPSAVVPTAVKSEATMWLQDHGYPIYGYDLITFVEPEALYLHSVLLGAWATGGLLALPFWLLAVSLVARGLWLALRDGALAQAYLLLVALWHIFFSPLGDVTRGHIAVAIALSVTALYPRGKHHRDRGSRDPVADGGSGSGIGPHDGSTDRDAGKADGHPDRQHNADQSLVSPPL